MLEGLFILWIYAAAQDYGAFVGTTGWVPHMVFDRVEDCIRLQDFRREHFTFIRHGDEKAAICFKGDVIPEGPRQQINWK